MNSTQRLQQHGLSFSGFIFGAFLLVLASITGLKVIPAYIQYGQIKNTFAAIAHDPDMQNATARDIRSSFDKRADIDDITAIKADDIEIVNDKGNLVLSASYAVKVPLAGNVSLFLEFNPSSDK